MMKSKPKNSRFASSPKSSTLAEIEPELTLNLGDLRKFVDAYRELPDTTPVCYQRISDQYFNKRGWRVIRMAWDWEWAEHFEQMRAALGLERLATPSGSCATNDLNIRLI